jgi:hypothetical protein
LLDDFARLAANIAGTSASVIGVRGRRNDPGPRPAVFGLLREQATMFVEIDRILASSPRLTVVPDLPRDERFAAQTPAFGHPVPRFLGHLKLLSSGGERIGFICVVDQSPRPGLTEAQAASLEHIAGMIMADRQRQQRHLHLMHVADRALRVDRMLRLVSEAASCADALTSLLEELCRFHGAAVGRIWQLIRLDQPMHEVSRYDEGDSSDDGSRFAEPSRTRSVSRDSNRPARRMAPRPVFPARSAFPYGCNNNVSGFRLPSPLNIPISMRWWRTLPRWGTL